jgi:GNAT superfamily N-acetyltransferase
MALEIRTATEADLPLYLRLLPELHVDDPPPSLERWRSELGPATLVATKDGLGLGFCWWQRLDGSGYIRQLVSAPEARRLGVGRALLEAVATKLRDAGCKTWRLNVKPDNAPALALYASLGFKREYGSASLGLDWDVLERLPRGSLRVRRIEPDDEMRVEAHFQLPSGQLANARAARRVMLLAVDSSDAVHGLALFNPDYPGSFPFRVTEKTATRALLEAMRENSLPGARQVGVVAEKDDELVGQLISAGATVRMVFEHHCGVL